MKRSGKRLRVILALSTACLLGVCSVASAEVFAAAASLQPVMEKIAVQFEKEKGIHMDSVFGASGALA
ncbi:MAG: hypothetical protein ACC613_00005, partial [Synergistales bacterium]